jgi:hypothetical protein
VTGLTRRQALAAAAVPVLAGVADADAAVTGPAAVLQPVERAELLGQAAYRAAARSPAPRVRQIAGHFRIHEDRHVAALATSLDALGVVPAPRLIGTGALRRAARAARIAPPAPGATGPEQLEFLLAVEERMLGAWLAAHRGLRDANLLQAATEVLACQAQHLVVLRDALGRNPLPAAFERGS